MYLFFELNGDKPSNEDNSSFRYGFANLSVIFAPAIDLVLVGVRRLFTSYDDSTVIK